MNDNNFADIPDLNQALSLTEQYEEYKYLRVWGLFILIDAIVLFMSITAFNNLITRRGDLIGFKYLLEIGLTLIQFFILLILAIKIGRSNKRTRLKLGKIAVAPHWIFFSGLIGIKVIYTIVNWILRVTPYNPDYNGPKFFLISNALILCVIMTLYYILMKKLILKHDFKEMKYLIFTLLGWIGFVIITVFILHIDEYFGWNEITITLYTLDSGIGFSSYDVLVFGMIVYYITNLIIVICEVILGIIAFIKSEKLINGDISEMA